MGSGRGPMLALCCVLLLSLLSLILSIAEIVMGAKYLHDCPVERFIPIYLIVSGCAGILLSLSGGSDARDAHQRRQEQQSGETQGLQSQQRSTAGSCCACVRGLLSLFAFVWMCIGMYWVLHVRGTVTSGDPEAATYCNGSLYTFALVMVFIRLAVLVLMGAMTLCICCGVVCCAACMA